MTAPHRLSARTRTRLQREAVRRHLDAGHDADQSGEDSEMTPSPACASTDTSMTPSSPPELATPTPYDSIDAAIDDLALEMQAHLSVVRRLRERHGGLPGKELGTVRHLTIPDAWITPLAQGATLRQDSREWTLALIACHGELPIQTWKSLRDDCIAWRTTRLACSPDAFPFRQLSALTAQLEPLVARLLCCDLVSAAGNDLVQVLLRCTYGPTHLEPTLGHWANLLGDDRRTRRRCDLRGLFGRDSLAVRLGIYEPPGLDDDGLPPEDWTPRLCRPLLAQLLGQSLDHLGNEPGVTILHPTERFADVVLTPTQLRLARTIDLGWSARATASNALGVLLHGPSGTGKTLLAKALAGEAGMPLILVDGRRRRTEHVDENDAFLGGLVRRAAAERAVLFIDEADDVIPDASASSRSLLTALERFPAVVVLATNQPLRFDPALDRRLQIKIAMDLPGPQERTSVLRLELARQQVPLAAGVAGNPQVSRLAESARLSGGHLRNVVQVAAMVASQRSGAAGEPVTLEDLAEAVRLQIAGEQVVDVFRSTRLRWVERPSGFETRPLGAERSAQAVRLVSALERLRIERAGAGLTGLGSIVVITGPERRLAEEVAQGLASALRLPLARLGEAARTASAPARGTDDDHGQHRGRAGALDSYEAASCREPAEGTADDADDVEARRERWSARDIADALADLGDSAVVHLTLSAPEMEQGMDVIDALATSAHLTVLHLVGRAVPAGLRRRAAVVLPWAVVDPATRRLRWEALGGQGEPPAGQDLADLAAAAARGHLARCGWSGVGVEAVLP